MPATLVTPVRQTPELVWPPYAEGHTPPSVSWNDETAILSRLDFVPEVEEEYKGLGAKLEAAGVSGDSSKTVWKMDNNRRSGRSGDNSDAERLGFVGIRSEAVIPQSSGELPKRQPLRTEEVGIIDAKPSGSE